MQVVNRHGLPEPLVAAVRNDDYSRGESDISVTQLIDAPLIRKLGEVHRDRIVVDASDRIFALFGQAVHGILERAGTEGIREERLFATIRGKVLSGAYDRMALLPTMIMQDYKVPSVFSVIYNTNLKKWGQQLNCLAHLARINGYDVKGLEIVAVFRDWSRFKASKDKSYPQAQVQTVPIDMWRAEEAEAFVEERMKLHFEQEPPPCNDDDMWVRGGSFAVMKKGRKRAVKLFKNESDAVERAEKEGGHVESRPKEYVRCEAFCDVRAFCPQRATRLMDF